MKQVLTIETLKQILYAQVPLKNIGMELFLRHSSIKESILRTFKYEAGTQFFHVRQLSMAVQVIKSREPKEICLLKKTHCLKTPNLIQKSNQKYKWLINL